MKIGIFVGIAAGARPDSMATVAEHAERLGFGTLWAPEHVVLFDRYTESKYPYSQDGAFAATEHDRLDGPVRRADLIAAAAPARFASRPASAWCRNIIRWCSRK